MVIFHNFNIIVTQKSFYGVITNHYGDIELSLIIMLLHIGLDFISL